MHQLFFETEKCIKHISMYSLEALNEALTETEKLGSRTNKASLTLGDEKFKITPNAALASQIIEEKVINMLIFLALRHSKAVNDENEECIKEFAESMADWKSSLTQKKAASTRKKTSTKRKVTEQTEEDIPKPERPAHKSSVILERLATFLKMLTYEMHSYDTPMAPFVKEVLEFVVMTFVGEENILGSDFVLAKTSPKGETLTDFLRDRSFMRNEKALTEKFAPD
jgi:hypothetical protein